MSQQIKIQSGTIVGYVGSSGSVTLEGDVYVTAARDMREGSVYEGMWIYEVGGVTYCCSGGLATEV